MEKQYPLADTQIADQAIETLHNISRDKPSTPFFVAVGFHRPHLPFVAPQRKYELYPADSIVLPADQQPPKGMPEKAWSNSGELTNGYDDIRKIHPNGLNPGQTLPSQTTLELRRAYYAAVSHMDEQVGRVLDALEATGLADKTVISFWGDHGWQLGELGEWCKHTNFELATRAPMMIRVPGITDGGKVTQAFSEHIDLFPTLTQAAAGVTLPACPEGQAILNTDLCTMGRSLLPLIKGDVPSVNNASFSQYPRGYGHKEEEEEEDEGRRSMVSSTPSASACLSSKCVMGYSMATRVNGHQWRYTEWVGFNAAVRNGPDWSDSFGVELYDIDTDGPAAGVNLHGKAQYAGLEAKLSAALRSGPSTGGGWGPYHGKTH